MENKFSERLKELREESNLTQKTFANKLNISKSAVSAWEIGRNQPSYDLLIEIAKFFNVSTDYLLGIED